MTYIKELFTKGTVKSHSAWRRILSEEPKIYSVRQEIPHILWNLKFHECAQTFMRLAGILMQKSAAQTASHFLMTLYFTIPHNSRFSKRGLSFSFAYKDTVQNFFPLHATCPTNPLFLSLVNSVLLYDP